MEPASGLRRPLRMRPTAAAARAGLVMILTLAAATASIGQVAACSCIGFRTPEEQLAAHDVTFLGTVVDSAAGERGIGGNNVRYAFDVERASAPTDALLVVQAVDDGGGASCGFAFAMGERWLVSASRQDAALETSLCSNNQHADDMAAGDLAAYTELLPNVPPEPVDQAPERSDSDNSVPLAIGVALLGLLGLMGVTVLAFRRGAAPS